MGIHRCGWEYCNVRIPTYENRCPEHRDMKWWEEYIVRVEHLCWEEEEIPLEDFEDALDIVYDARGEGGPKEAALRLEREHGIDPRTIDEWRDRPIVGTTRTF